MNDKPLIFDTAASLGCLPTKQTGDRLVSGNCPSGHGSDGKRCFNIYLDTDSWYCWNCRQGGDAYDLIKLAQKTDFKGAVVYAKEHGLIQDNGIHDDKQREICKILTEVARFFHDNLPDNMRLHLQKHYGFTDATINQYSIGYAPTDSSLLSFLSKKFSVEQINQTGLLGYGKPFFSGQIIFPYWQGGLVRYMIGRQTSANPDKAKYEKLKVTDIIKNNYFYGEDSILKSPVVYVTEGVTDCLAALQANLPSISPVTTQFKKSDYPKLLSLVKGKTVYLIPDNEKNESGMRGAVSTLEFLKENQVKVFIITLPRPEGAEKIDLNEYMRDNSLSLFMELVDEQNRIAENQTNNDFIQDLQEWIDLQDGVFTVTELDREFEILTKTDKKFRRGMLKQLVESDVIKRTPDRPGWYSRVDHTADKIDWMNADPDNIYRVIWPLGLQNFVKIFPKNIVVIAGASNAGKTAFLLNVAIGNCRRYQIKYLSSEMGPEELKNRIIAFNYPEKDWESIDFRDRSYDFSTKIDPDGLNIIDYLEISDNFFAIGAEIKAIYDKLKSGIAVIAIQKKSNSIFARGGEFTLEKARLYLTIDPGVVKIIKGKNWAQPGINPKDMDFFYKLTDGCLFTHLT